MPIACSALGCTNRFIKGSEIRFYRFPISKPQLAEQWVRSLGRKNFVPTTNSCLCSEHFQPDCFRDYNGKQFLREDAVPTIFSNWPKAGGDGTKIELRKSRGGLVTKDESNRLGSLPDGARQFNKERRQTARETSLKGRTINDGYKRRGGAKIPSSDRQGMAAKSKVYDSQGLLISCGRDLCDCLDVDCMGCFYPCPDCGSRKCGVECRCDRKWLYEQVEVEGGEIIRNKYAG
ncbi:ARL14 effector protein [Colossoma macropomum]|uniref:THAP-type domain-containing protein n=1 Tax=Pygocentrus nattereri TaxID=42514 RepID=A0AAR2LGG5_PYGNA|nr:ARL14 effector protein [Pygocentrus nattereri]XP_036440085.1 ARL14 effector protein [Colossoma macropomum]